jgi:hypothetical protein
MRLTGHLVNAADPARNDVFDAYAVQIRYLVFADHNDPPAYRQVLDSFTCRDKDNAFAFELPEVHEIALDTMLEISVLNRSQAEVLKQERLLASLLRSEKPLELRIAQPEPPQVVTPLALKGRLVWRDDPGRQDGFSGFRLIANYKLREQSPAGVTFTPRVAVFDMGDGNGFDIALPNREALDGEPIAVEVKYPGGQRAAFSSFPQDELDEPVEIEVDPQQLIVVKSDTRTKDVQPEKLKGKVVDLQGKVQVGGKQVVIWSQAADGKPRPVFVAVTDGQGNFSGERPKERFTAALATVAGTMNATPEEGLPVDLVELSDGGPATGLLPKFVYLVVSMPAGGEKDKDCGCDSATPRLPDAEDLVSNPGTYSQDIGLNCVNFTTPNRTLEECTYTLVVRTTDPAIKGTTLSDIDRRTAAERELAAKAAAGVVKHVTSKGAATPVSKHTEIGVALSDYKYLKAAGIYDSYKTVAERGELSAQNSVDWDGTPTFYQATSIAHGHILHYKQIWKADGYSLGDLVYSLPLAPGQKKQVVIFDWDRTEYGRRDEDKHEDEALSSYLSHNRDLYDITHSSLSEHMKGGSSSRTSGSAGGIGGGIGAMIGPVMIGVAGGYSASSGKASSSAWQDSSREVAASGLNQLRDMVQQGASAVRNQRSTVVQTARQTERFKVETEVVANHNHCHAITIQYFEVLRHYAIEQKLTHVQECLFIPLLMSAFDIPKIVRWQDILRATLLLPPRRGPLQQFGAHPLIRGLDAAERIAAKYEGSDFPTGTYASEGIVSLSGELTITFQLNRPLDDDDKKADDANLQEQLISVATLGAAGWSIWWPYLGNSAAVHAKYFANQKVKYKNRIFEERVAPDIAARLVNELTFTAVHESGMRYPLVTDTTLVSNYQRDTRLMVTVRPAGPVGVRRDQITFIEISTAVDLSASERSKIIVNDVTLRYSTPHMDGYLARNYRADNDLLPGDPVKVFTPLSADEKRDARKEDIQFSNMLIEHLNANLEYYHKAIWQRMDPDRRYMLLDGFVAPNAGGKSVASVVENQVIGIAGNSLIMPVAPGYKLDPSYEFKPLLDGEGEPRRDEQGNIIYEQTSLLEHYQPLTPIPPFRISVPTRGVFGESIMGACNACEKKEEERFWRWEESPNPDEPTLINPIQTSPPQRSDPGDLKAQDFPAPMINIQNAPGAPDPGSTLAGALGVLGSQSLFPNITGLDQNQKNALQAMLSNQEAAKHFTDKAVELAKQASNLRSGNTTVDNIKKSMDDGTLDKETGKKLVADVYRAQIGGKTQADEPTSSAASSDLGKAAAEAVRGGREVKASQTHPDGTQTQIEQGGGVDLSSAAAIGLERPDPANPGKWLPIPLGEGPGMAQFDGAFSAAGTVESDFPARDSGRFRIVLTDPAFKASSSEKVSWNTIYDNGKNQSFEAGGATTLELLPDPADPARRVSAPLVIVADAEDLPIANAVGSGKNARLGGMFGRIVVERDGKRFEGPILARARHWLLPVHIFVVKRSAGDGGATAIPPLSAAALATQLRGMQQIFEPHGLFFNSQPYTFSAAQQAFSPVQRTAGTEVVYNYYEIDIPAAQIGTLPNISLDDVNKLGALFPPNAGGPVLRLFFVPGFDSPTRMATSINQSRADSFTTLDPATRAALVNSVYIGPNCSRGGAAHEVGHTLMDKRRYLADNGLAIPAGSYQHHYRSPAAKPGYPESHNLMQPSDGPTMRRIWRIADADGYDWKEALEVNRAKLLLRP